MIRRNFNKLTQSGRERNAAADLDYETTAARDIDNLKTDNKEILGETKNLLHGRYRLHADLLESRIPRAEAGVDKQGVREQYLHYRDNRAKVKIDRLQSKIDSSSNSIFSKYINHQRKQTIDNLQYKNKVRAKGISKLENKRKSKPEEIRKQIDKIVNKKIEAMRRKAERKVLREEYGIQPRNLVKRAEFIAKMSPQDKRKVVREAILQVRKSNIEKGILDPSYEVDDTLSTRKIGEDYGRTIE